jgi:WD40 repeat protein
MTGSLQQQCESPQVPDDYLLVNWPLTGARAILQGRVKPLVALEPEIVRQRSSASQPSWQSSCSKDETMTTRSFLTFVASCVVVSAIFGQTATGPSQADGRTETPFKKVAVIKALDHPRHPGARLIRLNDDKDVAAVAMYGCTTVFWDLKTNAAIGEPTRQSGDAGAIGFIPNSNLAYIADWNNLQVWNQKTALKSGEGFPHQLREDTVIGPAISPDGKFLVTRNEMKSFQFWNLETGMSIGPEHLQDSLVTQLQFSADSKWCFSRAGSLSIWNPWTGGRVAGPIRNDIYTTAYLPARQYLVTFEHDRKDPSSQSRVLIRSGTSNWSTVRQFELPGQARDAEWIDQDRLLVVGTEVGEEYKTVAFIVYLDRETPRFDVIFNSDYRIFDFAVTKDRQHLVTISIGKVSCWTIGDAKPKWEREWTGRFWRKKVFGTDSDWVMAHASGEDAIAYSIKDGSELWRKKEVIYASTDGDHILVTDKDGAEVWRWGGANTE